MFECHFLFETCKIEDLIIMIIMISGIPPVSVILSYSKLPFHMNRNVLKTFTTDIICHESYVKNKVCIILLRHTLLFQNSRGCQDKGILRKKWLKFIVKHLFFPYSYQQIKEYLEFCSHCIKSELSLNVARIVLHADNHIPLEVIVLGAQMAVTW